MANLHDYKSAVEDRLLERIFENDPTLVDSNIYVNRSFGGTLQQLVMVRNWDTLSKSISQEELWALLKLQEYRLSKLVFDGQSGHLIADASAQELYKKYYYNSLWIDNDNNNTFDIRQSLFNPYTILCIVLFLIIVFYIINTWNLQQEGNDPFGGVDNLLNLLETTTQLQQWPSQ